VVGRLIEEDVLRAADEDFREGDAHLPAAGELAAGLLPVGGFEAEAVEDAADAGFDAVAVEGVELFEEAGLLVDEGIEVALAGFDGGGDAGEFAFDGGGFGEGAPELLEEGVAVVEAGFLAEVAEVAPAVAGAAGIGRFEAGDEAEDG
jgi:hypothetical protein